MFFSFSLVIPFFWRSYFIIQSFFIQSYRPLVYHLAWYLSFSLPSHSFLIFWGQRWLKTLFKGLLHINVARKAAVTHLMRWWQIFPQIFLHPYPFRVHLQSIFTAGTSQKVDQGKTRPTLLIYARSEEVNPVRSIFLDTLHALLLVTRFPKDFFSSDVSLIKCGT